MRLAPEYMNPDELMGDILRHSGIMSAREALILSSSPAFSWLPVIIKLDSGARFNVLLSGVKGQIIRIIDLDLGVVDEIYFTVGVFDLLCAVNGVSCIYSTDQMVKQLN